MNLVDTPVSFLQVLISGGLKSFVSEVLILKRLLELAEKQIPRATLLTRESS
jgi:hypothetical protein